MRAFILNPTYRVVRGTPEVHLYCVLESGEPGVIIDDRVRPYIFVRQADELKVRKLAPSAALASCDLRSLAGEEVLRLSVTVPGEVPALRARLEDTGVECFEADIRFAYRYMMDQGICGSVDVEGPYVHNGSLGRIYRNPALHPCQWVPQLRFMSLDLETGPDGATLYSVALHGPEFSHVIIRHNAVRPQAGVETVDSEPELIRRFLQHLSRQDPDILTGWNVVDFDLVVLARAAKRHGMSFAIGRTDDDFDSRKEASYTRESRALTFGRLVLDAQSLMRGAFIRLQDYKLETAAQTILGRGKLIKGADRRFEIERLYHTDPQSLVQYNLEDARLVTEILERTGLINLAIQRSLLTGMPLDRVSAAIASIDSLYLRALRSRRTVAPSVSRTVRQAGITGGYVMDAQPGLYRNVLVFDFKSLYPSIIRTFNLDPLTLVPDGETEADALEAPNGARFRRDVEGILPGLVARVAGEREQARQAGQAVKAHAMKILMNSLYGVLGSGASRLFFPSVANAITYFGQLLIQTAAEFAAGSGYRVIYGDTDSLFIDSADENPVAEPERLLDHRPRRHHHQVPRGGLRRFDLRRLQRLGLQRGEIRGAHGERGVPVARVERRHRERAPHQVGCGGGGHLQQQDRRRALVDAGQQHPRRDVRDVRQRRPAGALDLQGPDRHLQRRGADRGGEQLQDLRRGGDGLHQRQRLCGHQAEGDLQPVLPGLCRRQRAELLPRRHDRRHREPAGQVPARARPDELLDVRERAPEGLPCVDNFAQYMGADYDSNGDGQVDSDALRYVAGESEASYVTRITSTLSRRCATPTRIRVLDQQLRLHPVGRHPSDLHRRHRQRGPVRRHHRHGRAAPHDVPERQEPDLEPVGHERIGWGFDLQPGDALRPASRMEAPAASLRRRPKAGGDPRGGRSWATSPSRSRPSRAARLG